MKYFFISAILLCSIFSASVYAQHTYATNALSGIVKDSDGKPLTAATIHIVDLKIGSITNDSGFFEIKNIPKGKFWVEVQYVGYTRIAAWISVDGDTKNNFTLQPNIIENNEVTVTGVSRATNIRQLPTAVHIVRKEHLLQTASTNIIDAISQLPGVSAVSTGPAIAKPFIRGLGYNRVVVINDGVRQEGQQWGDEHGIEIDEYSVNKIEVIKGPASVMYGSDALGGVINIMSDVPVPNHTIKANVLGTYQTNSGLIAGNMNIAGHKNGFSWNMHGTYKNAHDYSNKYDGYVFNSKFLERNVGSYFGYNGTWGYSHIRLSTFDQKIGLVEGERDSATGKFIKILSDGTEDIALNHDFTTTTPVVPYQRVQHFKVSADNNFNIGKHRLSLMLSYQRNQRKEFGDATAMYTPSAYFDLQTVNYNMQLHIAEKNNWRTSVGINGMQQTNKNKADEAIIPNYNLFDVGTFIFSQYHYNTLNISGGLRFDYRNVNGALMMDGANTKFNTLNTSFANISGGIGLSYPLSTTTILKLNVARGFRAPNMAELSSNGAHEGTSRYEVGNKNLTSETSLQIDAGADWQTEHLSINVSAFYNHINHFIFYEKMLNENGTDSVMIDALSGDELNVFQFKQSNAYLYGIELHSDIHPHPLDWLHIENTFSYIQGHFTNAIEGTTNLPLMQAPRWIFALRGNVLPKGKIIRNVYASVEMDYAFKQTHAFTAFNTETPTSDYKLINAGIGGDIVRNGKAICGIHISATNIADVAYQNHLSRLKYTAVNNVTQRQGVFNMGRNFSIKINVPLGWKW
jgi:iron complex outermembrane receptor protein